jgi:DNA-binding NarL/FixJ family response regulator
LTSREREIATVASQGVSNKKVADTTTMSVRAVEGHIHPTCSKFGVASRVKLAYLMGPTTFVGRRCCHL